MQISVTKTDSPKLKPDSTKTGFGVYTTDHMFTMHYSEERGWHDAQIIPYNDFSLDPASMVFHYAQECFEGLKAYRTDEGDVQLFRVDQNAKRMARTHKRLCIPEIPVEDFVQAVEELVGLEADWVPNAPDTSMYIRPCTIATEAHLGVKSSSSYLFFIICSPSGPYYESGLDPVKIYVEEEYTRASVGGVGAVKCGGNYAASIASQMKAKELGYSQVLWLDSVERKYAEEVGSMNIFFKIDGEIYTAKAGNTVLPGITRLSCIELMQDWGYVVNEGPIAIEYIMQKAKEGKVEEIFGTGTAAVISPIGELCYKNEIEIINNNTIGLLTARLYETLTGMQYGRLSDNKGWITKV